MNINQNNLISIPDEQGNDMVEYFLEELHRKSRKLDEEKLHLMFLNSIFNLLSVQNLENLINFRSEITITFNGEQRTKSYYLVKPLRVKPIYELRYGLNSNEHLRLLFFPLEYKNELNYVFVKVFIKTRIPKVDETDLMRDLTFKMYEKVKNNPKSYLEGFE